MKLEFEKTFIPGLLLIKPDIFGDERGYFFESFSKQKYINGGIDKDFVQDNISKSVKGTVRGLHYQVGAYAQEKLCMVAKGKILDVAVDIRFGSPTFGKYFAAELSEENKLQMWIPAGFAHGFSVLSDEAIFVYKCTAPYSKEDERGIIFNDSKLNIDWKVENPLLSDKDKKNIPFKEIDKDFYF